MRAHGRWVMWLWAAALGLFLAPAARCDEPVYDPAAFEKGLKRAQAHLAAGKGEKGLKEISTLLATHKGHDYARARRAEFEDLAKRLAFCKVCKQPEPQDVVSGKLLKWTPATGQIRVRYRPKTASDVEDWELEDGVLWHSATFTGPVTLEVKGKRYPETTKESALVVFGGDKHPKTGATQRWTILFGTPPYTEGRNEVWLPARIIYRDGEEKTTVAEKEITPAKPGRSYKLTVIVGRSRITAKVNNKSIGSAKKHKEVWGILGFEAPTWTEATVSGQIEPAWIQSKLDDIVQHQLTVFDKRYDRSKYLPGWLFEAAKTPRDADADVKEDGFLPAQLAKRHQKVLREIRDAEETEDYGTALTKIEQLRAEGAPEAICLYLTARMRMGRRDLSLAVEALTSTIKLAPDHLESRLLLGTALRRLGRSGEAAQAYREALAGHPKSVRAYEQAVLAMLRADLQADARAFGRDAVRNGASSRTLDLLNSALVKAEKGPRWNKVYEHKSRNYHVLSDIGKRTCQEASKVLEEAFTSYRVNFGWVSRDAKRLFKVYLFSGQAGFMTYQEDLAAFMGKPSERAAGLYSPLLKQLLIWNLPSREAMMETIRHEGFHQYLDRFMPDPPIWFNEGFACYHENAEKVGGRLRFGQPHRQYVELLEQWSVMPLKDFLAYSPRKFYEGGHNSYAQSWAFIHMLRHGDPSYRGALKQLIEDLQSKEAPMAVRKAFPEADLAKLDQALKDYIKTLAGK